MSDQISDTGKITKIDNNFATIAIDSTDNCKACGIRFLCSPGSDNQRTIKLENIIDAQVGDRVVISEASNVLLKLSFLQYGLPLIGFILGISLGREIIIKLRPLELYQFLYGMIGLGIAGLISYMIIKSMAKKQTKLFKFEKI